MTQTPSASDAAVSPEDKLSERLAVLAEPFREDAQDVATYNQLMTVISLAWNVAVLPRAERAEQLFGFMQQTGMDSTNKALVQLLSDLVDLKDVKFPDDQRWIRDWKVIETEQGLSMVVGACDYQPGMKLGQ